MRKIWGKFLNNFDTNLDLKMINHILVLLSKGLSNYGRSLYDRVDQFKRNQKCYLTTQTKPYIQPHLTASNRIHVKSQKNIIFHQFNNENSKEWIQRTVSVKLSATTLFIYTWKVNWPASRPHRGNLPASKYWEVSWT